MFLFSPTDVGGAVGFEMGKEEDSEKKDEMDDDTMFTTLGDDDKSKPSVAPRWVTRVFAADCLCRIIHLCENADKAHFDLASARSARAKNPKGNRKASLEGTLHCEVKLLALEYGVTTDVRTACQRDATVLYSLTNQHR